MTEEKSLTETLILKAKEYTKNGVSIFPLGPKKEPLYGYMWAKHQQNKMTDQEIDLHFKKAGGLGVIGGSCSGSLEIIDVDVKDDITGRIWEDYSEMLKNNLPELYPQLVIARSKNGGKHIYFRCSVIGRNDGKIARSVNKKVVIETRAEGGYVAAAPTPGYEFIQGDSSTIPTITPEERSIIFGIAESFNLYIEPEAAERAAPRGKSNSANLSPFQDYSDRGDVVQLLVDNGWTEGKTVGKRTHLLRPGDTDSKTSGNFHQEKRVLFVHSTNAAPLENKKYGPTDLFILLECGGDKKIAYRRLLENGFGEPYQGENPAPTQLEIRTIEIKVESRVTSESTIISVIGERLKIENIQVSQGDSITITSPGEDSREEVLKAIELASETGKQIYVKEGKEPEIRSYQYQLQAVLNKYGTIGGEEQEFTDRDLDSLTEELTEIGSQLKSNIDLERYKKLLFSIEAIAELGITEDSLLEAVERITAKKAEAAQAADTRKLHDQTAALIARGDDAGALTLMVTSAKEIQQQSRAADYSRLLEPTTEAQIREEQSTVPESLNSGFTIAGAELLLPASALSVFAAQTGHGKTLMLINTILNVAEANPDKQYLLFTYEEPANNIIQYFLNAYINHDLNRAEDSNRRLLKEYFRTGDLQYIGNKEFFEKAKDAFFTTYIETGRILIKYVNYDSAELTGAIEYLKRKANIGGVFIDYFQLLKLPADKFKNYSARQEELKQICIDLKDVAIDTKLPIVLAAQFNREVNNLMKLHPTNIGEAGDIERIVNTLIGLWDISKKTASKGEKPTASDSEIDKRTGSLEQGMYIELLKSRDLPAGAYEVLDYNGNTGKLKNKAGNGIKVNDNPFEQ